MKKQKPSRAEQATTGTKLVSLLLRTFFALSEELDELVYEKSGWKTAVEHTWNISELFGMESVSERALNRCSMENAEERARAVPGKPICMADVAIYALDDPGRQPPAWKLPKSTSKLFQGPGTWKLAKHDFTAPGRPSSVETAEVHARTVPTRLINMRQLFQEDPSACKDCSRKTHQHALTVP